METVGRRHKEMISKVQMGIGYQTLLDLQKAVGNLSALFAFGKSPQLILPIPSNGVHKTLTVPVVYHDCKCFSSGPGRPNSHMSEWLSERVFLLGVAQKEKVANTLAR